MSKYWRYLKRIYHMSALKLQAYPLNSFMGSITRVAYLISAIGTLYFSFRFFAPGATLFGASFEHCVMIVLFYQSCFYFLTMFSFTGDTLTKQILYGNLDYIMIKPLALRFSVIFQEFRPHSVFTFFISVLLIIAGYFFFSFQLSFLEIIAAISIFVISIILLTSLTLTFISIAFFFEGFGKNTGWFLDMSSQLVRYPKSMYPLFMQIVFFPMFYLTSPAFDLLQHKLDILSFLSQIVVASLVFICMIFLWKKGLREYSSAN